MKSTYLLFENQWKEYLLFSFLSLTVYRMLHLGSVREEVLSAGNSRPGVFVSPSLALCRQAA